MPDIGPDTIAGGSTSPLSAKDRRKLLDDHGQRLEVIRKKATLWGKGAGGMLAAVLGFSLVKGPSDISALESFWSIVVGILVAGALAAIVVAAVSLLRAAHGKITPVSTLNGRGKAILKEIHESEQALTRGFTLGGLSLVFIVAAVAVTWYAPHKDSPQLALTMKSGAVVCGQPESSSNGRAVLKTSTGQVTIDLNDVAGLKPVESCPK